MKNDRMRNIIVGTAGHIDHGKTALVRALTGVDTDRLAEEKKRGISIELGFAHLQLTKDVRIGFVDVPGHERFVKNMLAGVGGMDLVMLVIAADESIMPQTREHFDICRLIGVQAGLVALTKTDLVDEDILELARMEIEEFVAGSFLEGAPIVPVSARTGAGIDELRTVLRSCAAAVTQKDASRHFRLPVDRAFAMKGFGRVVTGTLLSGAVRTEDEVEIHPVGETVRIRGIQVHGEEAKRAAAGQRTALNVAGPAAEHLARGMTLTRPGLFHPTRTIDCRFEMLPSAKPLKHKAPIHFHAGTAEVIAEARLLESNEPVQPGQSAFVRFLLREPVLLLPGDRFIARMFSPVITIGGGTVLEIAPPPRIRRANTVTRLEALAGGKVADRIHLLVRESTYGAGMNALAGRTGLLLEEVRTAAQDQRFLMLKDVSSWLVDRESYRAHVKKIRTTVRDFHRANPLKPGMSKEELRSRELPGAPAFYLDAMLQSERELVADGEFVRLASHKVVLQEDEEAALKKIENAFRRAGLAVPPLKEVLEKSGVDPRRARNLLQVLLRKEKLVKVSDDLVFHEKAIRDLKALVGAHRGERFRVPQFKEWTGISRKYAIPLLEYLDRNRVTVREGDERVVV
jgi:selenocysteine-specific elongation factor